jgi:hypothetical protein
VKIVHVLVNDNIERSSKGGNKPSRLCYPVVIEYHKPCSSIDPAVPTARRYQMTRAGRETPIVDFFRVFPVSSPVILTLGWTGSELGTVCIALMLLHFKTSQCPLGLVVKIAMSILGTRANDERTTSA